uniref:Uncharacterized protein n=1 Tax=Glossina pallidipes TaxID=7398 RepID=A0A1A9ZQD3_GLOPL
MVIVAVAVLAAVLTLKTSVVLLSQRGVFTYLYRYHLILLSLLVLFYCYRVGYAAACTYLDFHIHNFIASYYERKRQFLSTAVAAATAAAAAAARMNLNASGQLKDQGKNPSDRPTEMPTFNKVGIYNFMNPLFKSNEKRVWSGSDELLLKDRTNCKNNLMFT